MVPLGSEVVWCVLRWEVVSQLWLLLLLLLIVEEKLKEEELVKLLLEDMMAGVCVVLFALLLGLFEDSDVLCRR